MGQIGVCLRSNRNRKSQVMEVAMREFWQKRKGFIIQVVLCIVLSYAALRVFYWMTTP